MTQEKKETGLRNHSGLEGWREITTNVHSTLDFAMTAITESLLKLNLWFLGKRNSKVLSYLQKIDGL